MSKYSVGLRNVGSYQISGHPYLTGNVRAHTGVTFTGGSAGEDQILFPYVTQRVLIINKSSSNYLRVTMVSSSHGGDPIGNKFYLTIDAGGSATLDVKCKEIYVRAYNSSQTYEIVADLTNIPTSSMYDLTGSGIATS